MLRLGQLLQRPCEAEEEGGGVAGEGRVDLRTAEAAGGRTGLG